jgi:hypothetical protein
MTRSERVSQQLKLRQLRVFLSVARTASMAKAAKQLATSQSVVSKAIAEMEHTLGVRLLDRTPPECRIDTVRPIVAEAQHRHIR